MLSNGQFLFEQKNEEDKEKSDAVKIIIWYAERNIKVREPNIELMKREIIYNFLILGSESRDFQ